MVNAQQQGRFVSADGLCRSFEELLLKALDIDLNETHIGRVITQVIIEREDLDGFGVSGIEGAAFGIEG